MALGRFTSTFTEFSGFTITADDVPCSGITYSITREQAPIFTMGPPSGGFKRGKRGVAGKLIAKEVLPDEVKLIHIEGDDDSEGQNLLLTVDIHHAEIIDGREVENGYEYTFYTNHGDGPVTLRKDKPRG